MNYDFKDIAGYETEKEELKRLCEIYNERDKYIKKGAKLPKGIIFYGEAGTGKTLFSKVMASVCNLEVFKISLDNAKSDLDVCKNIQRNFTKATNKANRSKKPTMVFFDELDKVLPNDNEKYYTDRSKTILSQLLTLIDGMDSYKNVIFVATCNYYESLPETLVRPGRIDKKIGLRLPDYKSRLAILNKYVSVSSCKFEVDVKDVASMTDGFSCAALETLVNECILRSTEDGIISEELIRNTFYEIKNEDIPRQRNAKEDGITACLNAGKYVVADALNLANSNLSLADDDFSKLFTRSILTNVDYYDDYDDYDEDYDDDDEEDEESEIEDSASVFSKNDYLNAITVLLGGYAAEELVYNKVYDNVSKDLKMVESIIIHIINCGMFGINLRYSENLSELVRAMPNKVEKIYSVIESVFNDCYERAKKIILENKNYVKALIKELTVKTILKDSEIAKIKSETAVN